jgi:uncharacterized protein
VHPARWPAELLDVTALTAAGWRPSPFREFVLKVHQRCNLACDYCYVYTMADQSWRDRPALMPADVRRAAATRIGAHARQHALGDVLIVLHGGEPMLAGTDVLIGLAGDIRAAVPPGCAVRLSMQSNGTLLDGPALRALAPVGVTVSVSLDGGAAVHDRRRRHRSGAGSHAGAARAIARLAGDHPDMFGGILATIDLGQDPVECYEELLSHRPPAIDFLLPHANWSSPPNGSGYGEWLVRAFDRWYDAPVREVRVRLFDEVVGLVLGGRSRTDQVGLSPSAAVVVETDGAIEQTDSLKSAYAGAAATPWNVLIDGFEPALHHPGFVARQIGAAALSETCLRCPVQRVCGGGHYPHRYRAPDGFRNPSVYCRDLRHLIDHVQRRVRAGLARRATR